MEIESSIVYCGESGWLHCPFRRVGGLAVGVEGDGGDNGYEKFYDNIGALIMGRLTYDEVLKQSDDFPYKIRLCRFDENPR